MQIYIDTATQQVWAFDDDVVATQSGGAYSFKSATGEELSTPATLQPYTVPAPPPPTLSQQAQNALAAGLTITSTGTPTLDGVYAVDAGAQANITATMLYVQVNGKFPGSSTTQTWGLMNGSVVVFPSTAEFTAFATAVANYAADLIEIAMTNTGTLPAATATIP